MKQAMKRQIGTILNAILITVLVLNAIGPLAAFAATPAAEKKEPAAERTLPPPMPLKYYHPKDSAAQTASSGLRPTPQPKVPAQSAAQPLDFQIDTQTAAVGLNQPATLVVILRNNGTAAQSNFQFVDQLKNGFVYVPDESSPVVYNAQKKQVEYSIANLAVGETLTFRYKVKLITRKSNSSNGELQIHVATLNLAAGQIVTTSVPFLVDSSRFSQKAAIAPYKTNGGWHSMGSVSVYLDKGAVDADSILTASPITPAESGPVLQYKLDVVKTEKIARDANGVASQQDLVLADVANKPFSKPGFIEFKLGNTIDLKHIPAGQEAYVATYDETSKVWVKVPIAQKDLAANTLTVEAAHFSTWGAGIGASLPQNGANVMLFDQPYTSLFSGSASYSIPIWMPKGRNGMTPSVSLSYSSGTYNGVLGDIQAPWVGGGWNIDGTEVVRKITTSDKGYGYKNEFALTVNGTKYDLVEDSNHPGLYNTNQSSFIYIRRHNQALGGSADAAPNAAGEWWEVVTTDGTRYRLGWNPDSEQLALMYGYSCTIGNPCTTPNGAYVTLGYAGKNYNLVPMRWRVDRVSDPHGNTMTYTYTEEHPDPASKLPIFDRASYLASISYTGTLNGDAPGYQVKFETDDRAGDNVPQAFNVWDNYDTQFLKTIKVCYGACATGTVVRSYRFDYAVTPQPTSNGTLLLNDIRVCGGAFTTDTDTCAAEFVENGIHISSPATTVITFGYQNLNNRTGTGSEQRYYYPRLTSINNGYDATLTYTYENDGRGAASWYNWRVDTATVNNGLGTSAIHGYTYETPVYSDGDTALDDLIGYTNVTDTTYDFNGTTKLLDMKHTFGTANPDTGYELTTQSINPDGSVLNKTVNSYITDNSAAPFPDWNYRYLYQTINYMLSNGALTQTTMTRYHNDPATGNLAYREDFKGNSLYRKQYYEYLPNFAPQVYILNKMTRALVVDANNAISADTRYHYGGINAVPQTGDLTLTQSIVDSDDHTIDTSYTYDVYGNTTGTRAYKAYGNVDTSPSGEYVATSTTYDSYLHTYPVTSTNALGNSSTSYFYTLGRPYQSTDVNGWQSTTLYDGLGRTVSTTPPGLTQRGVIYSYPIPDGAGNVPAPYKIQMQILDTYPVTPQYRSIWGIYDGLGRILQSQVKNDDTNQLLISDTAFNAQGAAYKQSTPHYVTATGGAYITPTTSTWDQSTVSEYDALGRNVLVTSPGNITTSTQYNGLTTTSFDPNNHQTVRTNDAFGRMIQVKETNADSSTYATTSYSYDVADRLVGVTDAQGNPTTLQYDWLGRKTAMHDPDMGVWSYDYGALGNMSSQTDARNQVLQFSYDNLNRMIQKKDMKLNQVLASYTYGTASGELGMRVGMTDASGSTTWHYINYGRTVTETRTINAGDSSTAGPLTKSSTSTSDWLGRPLTLTYPDSDATTYHYNALGQAESLQSSAQGDMNLAELAYNQMGQITTTQLGNGATITNNYDFQTGTYRLLNRRADMGSTNLMNFTYSYDKSGNITRTVDSKLDETIDYQYDNLDRLSFAQDVQNNGATLIYHQSYSYDKIGNLLQVNNSASVDGLAPGGDILASDNSPDRNTGQDFLASYRQPSGLNNPGDTATSTVTKTRTLTSTPSVVAKTATPSITLTPKNTHTSSPLPTFTPIFTSTRTATITITPTPMATAATKTATRPPTFTPRNTATITPTPTHTAVPVQVGYWKLDETSGVTLANSSGTNDGTLTGTLVSTNGVNGRAISLAAGKYITIPNNGNLQPANGLTVSAWVYSTAHTNTSYTILRKGDTSIDYVLQVNVGGYLEFRIPDLIAAPPGATPTSTPQAITPTPVPAYVTGPKLPLNIWCMVTGVYDPMTKLLKLYVNGVLVSSRSITGGTPTFSGGALYIGYTSHPWVGAVDEVRVYKGSKNDAEVAALFGAFATPTVAPLASLTGTPPTRTMTPTALPISTDPWGDGSDGPLVIATSATFNLNTNHRTGRTCADGIAYNVTGLGSTAATVAISSSGVGTPTPIPVANCLSPNDEVMLINLQDPTGANYSVGNFEFLRVAYVSGAIVAFTTQKTKFYGPSLRSDAKIGVGATQQKVMLIRVPNYSSVTVNDAGALTANAWNGLKYGVVVFRANGTLSVSGTITADGLGYRDNSSTNAYACGESHEGFGQADTTGCFGGGQNGQYMEATASGGGYGSIGLSSRFPGGAVYGNELLSRLYPGSAGGSAYNAGRAAGRGGGIIYILASTIRDASAITSNGGDGEASDNGPGAGGSIRIEAGVIDSLTLKALGGSADSYGRGRIAVYYQTSLAGLLAQPAAYKASIRVTAPTPTSAPTSIATPTPHDWGTGADGDLNVTGNFNLNTNHSRASRACPDGAAYPVIELTASYARINANPPNSSGWAGCIDPGDELLLINLQGTAANHANTGNYELLRVGGISNNTISFKTLKTKYYGANYNADNAIGVGDTQQRVMLMRVPNYHDVAINGTGVLTANAWDGREYGVTVFRANGTLSGNGKIIMDGLGYRDSDSESTKVCGESYGGFGTTSNGACFGGGQAGYPNSDAAGGGGYGTVGLNGGGDVYGTSALDDLYPGSAGGRGNGGSGEGKGGGIIYILAHKINLTGDTALITSNGHSGHDDWDGPGAGGSIRLEADQIDSLNAVTAKSGGTGGGIYSGVGRIAVYYWDYLSGNHNFIPGNPYIKDLSLTPTPAPTPTAGPTSSLDSYTKVMLHLDGADAATAFPDVSGKVWSASGNAQIDTTPPTKSGSSSLLLDGGNDDIHTSDSNDFNFAAGDFTLDFWVNFTALPASGTNSMFYAQEADSSNRVLFFLNNTNGVYQWNFLVNSAGVARINMLQTTNISTAAWHHMALARNGNNFMIFQDGVQVGATLVDASALPDLAAIVRIGTQNGASGEVNGRVDEYRVSKGIARWTSDFTPDGAIAPVNPGVNSLAAYWSLDETSGSRADSTGVTTLATMSNPPSYTTGVKGNALLVNSSSAQYVVGADNPSISLHDTAFTISAWTRFSELPGADQVIVHKWGVAGQCGYAVSLMASGQIRFLVSSDGTATTSLLSSQILSPNAWYHIAAVYDGAQLSITINGGMPTTLDYTAGVVDDADNLVIGTWTTDVALSTDEVAIWKRALTPSEIAWLYNNGNGHGYLDLTPAMNPGAANLAAYWSLDETSGSRADSTGVTNLATTSNPPSYTTGVKGNALLVNSSSSQYVVGADNPSISLHDTAFTISAWTRFSALPSADQVIVHKWGVAGQCGYAVSLMASGKIRFLVSSNGTATTSLLSSETLSPNAWYHIAAVYDGAQMSITINGGTPTTLAYTAGVVDDADNILIGTWGANVTLYTDEVAIWKRALNPLEIAWLYNNGVGHGYSDLTPTTNPSLDNLAAYWSLDETSGTRADSTGVTNLATTSNPPLSTPGVQGKALMVNSAASQYVVGADNPSISLHGTAFTISAWTRFSALPSADQVIVHKWGVAGLCGYAVSLMATGQIRFLVSSDGTATTSLLSSQTLFPNTWYHIAAVYDGAQLSITINGGTPTTLAYTAGVVDDADNLVIGTWGANVTLMTDEVAIWKRALNPSEIAWLYNNGKGHSYSDLAPATNPGTANLAAYWSLDETSGARADSTGVNTLATTSNPPSYTTGVKGNALLVNSAASQYAVGADNPSISLHGTAFTISAWTRFSALPGADQVIVHKWGVAGLCGYAVSLMATGKIRFLVSSDGTATTTLLSSETLSPNTWYHIAAVYDGAQLSITINGGMPTTLDYTAGVVDNADNIIIGTWTTDVTLMTDEVAIWKRALTPSEIAWLYNHGAGHSYSDLAPTANPGTGNLTAYWSLDETSGTRADSTGVNTLATTSNPPSYTTGVQGNALLVNSSSSQYVVGAVNPSISLHGTAFTISAWTRFSALPSANQVIVHKWGVAGLCGYAVSLMTTGQIRFLVSSDGTATTTLLSSQTLSPNTWYHIAAVYNGAKMSITINGGTPTTLAYTAGVVDNADNIIIGTWTTDVTLMTDEVAIWKRALTQPEIAWLYNHGAGHSYSDLTTQTPPENLAYTYPTGVNAARPHAVTRVEDTQNPGADVRTYAYDANGNMIKRAINAVETGFTYNADNRVALVSAPGVTAAYGYDGDGSRVSQRVITIVGNVTTIRITRYFAGGAYEVTTDDAGATIDTRKYYSVGGASIMDDGSGLKYFLTDQQGSTVATLDAAGHLMAGSQQRYMPFGQARGADTGINTSVAATDFGYTGQRALKDIGLMDYKARFYDPSLGRFIQPDTIVSNPLNAQTWNRYSYVSNNPIRFTDPSGHEASCNPATDPGHCGGTGTGIGTDTDTGGGSCNPATDLNHCGSKDKKKDHSKDDDLKLGLSLDNYMMGWTNTATAWSIYWNSNASISARWIAGAYGGVWVGAHIAGVVGAAMLAYAGITAISTCAAATPCRTSIIPDNAFVRFDPSKFDSSIETNGLQTSYSGGRLWFTQFKYVKDITDAESLETILYRKNLWTAMAGKFSEGATLRVLQVTNPIAAGVTNMTNGVPQWYVTSNILPSSMETIGRIP